MSWLSSIGSGISNYFSSGSGWSDIFKGILGGVAASSSSNSAKDAAKFDAKAALDLVDRQALQARKTSAFEAELLDYYKNKEALDNRIALDTYGQFSTLSRWAPGYVKPPMPTLPTKPVAS